MLVKEFVNTLRNEIYRIQDLIHMDKNEDLIEDRLRQMELHYESIRMLQQLDGGATDV